MKKRGKLISFKKNNKGSHVGVILSFIIFVVFLAFLYSTLEPLIKVEEEKKFLLEYLESALITKLNINLTTITVIIDGSVSENCVVLKNLINGGKKLTSNIVVKDSSKEIIPAEIDDDNLIVRRENSDVNFIKVYGSEEFEVLEEGSTSGCGLLVDEYQVSFLKVDEYVSQKNVEELRNSYLNEYEALKEELNVGNASEFGFEFKYNNGTIIQLESVNVSRSVYVEEVPIRYIDDKANILTGFITVKVW